MRADHSDLPRLPWDAQPGCYACGRAVGCPCSDFEGCRYPPMPAEHNAAARVILAYMLGLLVLLMVPGLVASFAP